MRRIFSAVATVAFVRQEADQDPHLGLREQISQVIAEAPNAPFCTRTRVKTRRSDLRDRNEDDWPLPRRRDLSPLAVTAAVFATKPFPEFTAILLAG
jgi:hypothetical protein